MNVLMTASKPHRDPIAGEKVKPEVELNVVLLRFYWV